MSDFVFDFLAVAEADDLRNVVSDLRAENDELRQATVRLSRLDEVLSDFGDQWAGRFIATDGDAFPEDASFSGFFMSAELQDIYDGNQARLAEVLNGVAQFWVTNGAAWAGGGNVKMYAGGHRIRNATASGSPHDLIRSVKIIWGDMAETLGAPDVQVYGYATSDSFTDTQHFRIELNHYYGSGTLAATTGMQLSQLDDTNWPGTITLFTSGGASITLSDGAIPYVIVNPSGINSDFYVRGQSDTNTLYVDASSNHVGIGLSAPAAKLHVKPVADEVVMIVQGYTGQTENLVEWRNNASGILGGVTASGRPFWGATTISSTDGGYLRYDISPGTSDYFYGFHVLLNNTPTATSTGVSVGFLAEHGISGSQNITQARGFWMLARHGGSGIISNLNGGVFQVQLSGTGGSVTFGRSLYILTPTRGVGTNTIGNNIGINIANQGAAFVTNAYGLYIDNQSGATNNYAILTNAGQVVFNEGGDAGADLRWEGDTEPYLLWGDASADALFLGGQTNAVKVSKGGLLAFIGTGAFSWIKYTAASVTLSAGTSTSTVSDLQSKGGAAYHIDEAAATPGINLVVEFTGVTAFNWVQILGTYNGGSTHAVSIQLYYWGASSWVNFDAHDGVESALTNHDFFVTDPSGFIGTGADAGKVRVRFIHAMAGNAAHDLDLDVVALYQ